jgi:ligand-binding sensor domain-containing protein/two-component sensor histidine kinase
MGDLQATSKTTRHRGRSGGRRICKAILSLLLPVLAYAEQLPIRIYRTADGLPRDSVNAIVTDKNGYLWFGTMEGLSRFDGYEFTNYGVNEGLPHSAVTVLPIARDGSLWFGTGRGLCRFNPESSPPFGQFTVYKPSAVKRSQVVFALAEDPDGSIWCGTDAGLFRLRRISPSAAQFERVDIGEPSEEWVNPLLVDRHGTLWAGTSHGLCRRSRDGQLQRLTPRNGLLSNSVRSLFEDRRGRIWVGTDRGACLLSPQPDQRRPLETTVYALGKAFIDAGLETSDGRLWLGSNHGLWGSTPGAAAGEINGFLNYGTADGLSDEHIKALREDRDGNLWLGSDTGGAMKIARNGIRTYTQADGLRRTSFGSLFENRAGDLFAITGPSNEGFLHRFDGKRFMAIPLRPNGVSELSWGWNQIGFEDHAGEWWVHSAHGLFRFPRVARFEQLQHTRPKAIYTKRDGLAGNEIFRLFEDSRGDVWISTTGGDGNGLSRWQRSTGSLRTFSREPGFPKSFYLPTAFREDRTGALWIGFFSGGVARYRDNRFQFFGPDEGIHGGEVDDIFTDHTGRLWIGTVRGGLIRFDDPALEHPRASAYTTAQGLSSNQVRCITEDLYGRLYIGTGRGLDRLNPDGGIEHFTSADGLAPGEPVVALRDRQGALWFGTTQGLSRWSPDPPQRNAPPPILIRGVRVRGVPQPISELGESVVPPFELAASQNQLQFDFVSISFRPAEKRRYQYMLEGVDAAWTPPTELRTVNYASLPPASYRFLVRAVDPSGTPSAAPATAAFTILPPYWQSWWFRLLALLGCGSLLYGAYRYNLNRLLELERVRTRIATDLHDDIGASLSRIAILSEVLIQRSGGDQGLSGQLSGMARSAREVLASMSDIVWAINPGHDHLRDLQQRMRRFASDMFAARNIDFVFRAPAADRDLKLSAGVRREVYLVFKEAVNNIVRHADCSRAEIDFSRERDWLTLRVSDNGKGLPVCESGAGNGLPSMRARATALGGEVTIAPTEGGGTTVALRVPLGRSRAFPWRVPSK